MRYRTVSILGGLLLFATASLSAEFPATKTYEVVEVGQGIFAFVSPESKTGVVSGNVVAIAGADAVLVVDSGRFPTLARRMIAEIRRRTKKQVKYLVHTHWHADHVLSDSDFRDAFPEVVIVSTGFTRTKIAQQTVTGLREIAEKVPAMVDGMRERLRAGKRRDGTPYSDVDRTSLREQIRDLDLYVSEAALSRPVVPDLAFEDSLVVDLGAREVRVAFLGRGNTAGDTVVFVPDSRVAVTGDLLVLPTPYGHGCYPGEWIGPGARLAGGVREAVRGGGPARAEAFRAYFVPSAVERAYQEAKGSFADENAVSPD